MRVRPRAREERKWEMKEDRKGGEIPACALAAFGKFQRTYGHNHCNLGGAQAKEARSDDARSASHATMTGLGG